MVWVVGLAGGIPLLLIGLPIALILLLKWRRRRRRRDARAPADRVSGGWDQVVDGALDLGCGIPSTATRVESAQDIDASLDGSTLLLARAADARVFGPEAIDDAEAARFWSDVDAALVGLRGGRGPWRRLRARLSTASLRRRGGGR